MKIKHYRAADMRQALRQVRDAQGPDAVILSSRRVSGGGVEVVAAVDYDVDVDVSAMQEPVRPEADAPTAGDYATLAKRFQSGPDLNQIHDLPADVNEELRTLRRMLETQLATLAWNDLSRRAPIQTELLRQLTMLGLAHDLAGELVSQLPQRMELHEAHRLALALMARRIETVGESWMEDGGVVAMVGPTGVGKTTLIAKLAARWVLRHGPRRIALVSADAVRIGAHEQMHMLGRLLGVTAHTVYDIAELPELLAGLAGQRLVLIDTAGASPRDPELARRLRLLQQMQQDKIESAIVLPASTQAGTIDEVLNRFALAQPTAVCITKMDEAASLGGILSALVRTKLPAAYVSDGQRVPEDLEPARSHSLVARAVDIAHRNNATPDDETMQRRISGAEHVGT
jgi:flagellar biosynthesis protein FlhF